MSVERNFSNFILGDNVYELSGGLIPEIAERLEVPLSDTPDSAELGRLVGVIGKNKVLRDNVEITAIPQDEAADMVDRSGVQLPLSRSLRTPNIQIPKDTDLKSLTATIMTGAVANWMDRTRALLESDPSQSKVYAVTGNRVMSSPTEVTNPQVAEFIKNNGVEPSESDYALEYVLPALTSRSAELVAYQTADGDEIADKFVQDHPELFADGSRVSFARVANAGIQLALQFRKAARKLNPDFDSNPADPQVYIRTDTLPVARTAEELKNATKFQSPFTGLRQVALTAKLINKASEL